MLSGFRPAKRRSLKPAFENIEIPFALEWDYLPGFLIDEGSCSSPEAALEPHVGAPAEAQQWFVDVCHLEIYLAGLCCILRPHDAASFAQVGNLVPISHFVLH